MNRNPVLLALIATGAIASFAPPANPQTYDYAQNAGVSYRQVRRLNYYARHGQSYRDVRRMLGSPNRVTRTEEIYTIRDTVTYYQGIPLNAGRQLVVRYGRNGQTVTWYEF